MYSDFSIILLPILALFALFFLSTRFVNSHTNSLRRLVTTVIGFEFLLALFVTVMLLSEGREPVSVSILSSDFLSGVNLSLYFDGVTCLMLLLISFVGYVVSRYSIRYLDGENQQGRFFRWLGITVAAVSLMVIAGNMLLLLAAWIITGRSLHQLLIYYSDRAEARRAASTRMFISRIGELLLCAAVCLVYLSFGTLELSELFLEAQQLQETTLMHMGIAWLLIAGAMIQSAQFPFHLWLPDTLETPTPVSALMHAGIVNAGGFLIIRFSPVVSLVPSALSVLIIIGTLTACYAGLVMMTQTSIKRSLAYSTIAQMGFMMLQCGLGAFSAAMLHILAHSLYKAYAFLNSGNVISHSMQSAPVHSEKTFSKNRYKLLLGASLVTLLAYCSVAFLFEVNFYSKPGGFVLGVILCFALTFWGQRLLTHDSRKTKWVAMVSIPVLFLAYFLGYFAIDHYFMPTSPMMTTAVSGQLLPIFAALLFCLLFVLHFQFSNSMQSNWLERLRVHATNGFYLSALANRFVNTRK